MKILHENQNPSNDPVLNRPVKFCVDWFCVNQKCESHKIKGFGDGGSLYPPGEVEFTCEYCGKQETVLISI
jgi:hypothetical protein